MPAYPAGWKARRGLRYTHHFKVLSNRSFLTLLVAVLSLSACAPIPDGYPPPFQRKPATGPEPHPVGRFVNMSDPDADSYIVRDISPTVEGSGWRWTFVRPELRFWLDSKARQKFAIDLAIAGATFGETGPVTLSFFINGKLLAKQFYSKPGDYHFEKGVPPSWLRTDTFTLVAIEADKLWVSSSDGARLGFILTRAGFVS